MVKQTESLFEGAQHGVQPSTRQFYERQTRLKALKNFAKTTAMLRAISEKELAQAELSAEETKFLQEIVVLSGMTSRSKSSTVS